MNQEQRLCKSKNKVLLVTFFVIKGILHYEYLEKGQTINKESYLNIMRRVRESIHMKRSEMWSSKNWIIHHDNEPPHTEQDGDRRDLTDLYGDEDKGSRRRGEVTD
ncbi:CLCN3 [Cordylochernes scorpioides]|uniref:CLCN3 n=1 Tax=Cordylochernes scorpioides TaxID=51811 RepID=A0ABY6LVB4_9ARAC|nr:CLCN3 [Cordylochernes scorpioides]